MPDSISVKVDDKRVLALFKKIRERAPKVAADIISHAAFSGRKAVQLEMQQSFDRPVPYTLNSMTVQKATPSRMEAKVWFKDLEAKSITTNRSHYLTTETFGGRRALKQFEAALQRVGAMPLGTIAVPTKEMPKDGFGNPLKSEITKIMAALGAFKEVGFKANKTAATIAKGKRGTRKRYGYLYFAATKSDPRTRHLRPGIYKRIRTGFGYAIQPLFYFVPPSGYRKRLRFFEKGYEAAQRTIAADVKTRFLQAITS